MPDPKTVTRDDVDDLSLLPRRFELFKEETKTSIEFVTSRLEAAVDKLHDAYDLLSTFHQQIADVHHTNMQTRRTLEERIMLLETKLGNGSAVEE